MPNTLQIMKKLAISLLAVTLFLTACSDKDEIVDQSPVNSFTYNGENVVTPYAYLFDWATDGRQIAFTDKDVLVDGFDGTASAAAIDLDTIISGRTYTFMSKDSAAYDRTKNFESAYVYFKQHFADGEFDEENGNYQDSVIGGSVTIKKNQEVYSVVYELKYKDITVKGEYNGEMEVVR
jgi:major membrane immunogen (membrane-anchored lipoprotein)